MNVITAMSDPRLFGPWFARNPESWGAWRAFIAATFHLQLNDAELAIYRAATARDAAPSGPVREAWLICGRRSGKSLILSLIAVYLACFRDYRKYLSPGERAMVPVMASNRDQATVILGYVKAFLSEVPMLAERVENETAWTVELRNRVNIEVFPSNYRSVRGRTVVAALCDEIAFWRSEDSVSPDVEVLNALRPAMATIPNSMLLCASSPYARRGALWKAHRKHYGKDSNVLVWQADSRTMNPTLNEEVIREVEEDDPVAAASEYGAEFRRDLESFLTPEVVDAVVDVGIAERGPVAGTPYRAFADPAGGSGRDSFTLAIAHTEDGVEVLDAVREAKPPFSPEETVADFANYLKVFHVTRVSGDRYAGDWPVEAFARHGITYIQAAKPKSDIYKDFLPLINSRKILLLDNSRLQTQLLGLERRTGRSGRDAIDHPGASNDDLANAASGALTGGSATGLVSEDALREATVDVEPFHA